MTRSVLYLSLAFSLLLSSCGNSGDNIQVNVLIPSGEEAIKTDIQTAMQNEGHRGVYFVVQELSNPVSYPYVPVQGGDELQYPNSATGLDPTKAKFTIKSGQLDQSKPYIIKMRAMNSNNQPTHEGIADCYIDFSDPNRNVINICFKALASTGNCTSKGFQSFAQCQ
ncbi:MAG TPA: hypothetical protein PKC21_09220 [Oligoflexia bacterium]|nr:hypothetical protein [Oligoflexia bacterium]HMR25518.1 hypothetical protein [Oligoflexia bacterium]